MEVKEKEKTKYFGRKKDLDDFLSGIETTRPLIEEAVIQWNSLKLELKLDIGLLMSFYVSPDSDKRRLDESKVIYTVRAETIKKSPLFREIDDADLLALVRIPDISGLLDALRKIQSTYVTYPGYRDIISWSCFRIVGNKVELVPSEVERHKLRFTRQAVTPEEKKRLVLVNKIIEIENEMIANYPGLKLPELTLKGIIRIEDDQLVADPTFIEYGQTTVNIDNLKKYIYE